MSFESSVQFKSRWAYWAALGAGCLVGASSMFLIQHLSRRVTIDHSRTNHELSKELASLHVTIKDLQEKVRELKEKKPLKSALRTVTFADVEESLLKKDQSNSSLSQNPLSSASSATDFYSAISSEDEFYDFSNDEDDELDTETKDLQKSLPIILDDTSDSILDLFQSVDDLCSGSEEEQLQALETLRENYDDLKENSEFLWRMCKAVYLSAIIAGNQNDKSAKETFINEAIDFGRRSIEANNKCSEAHKWYAIVVGSRGEFLGIKEKILDGYEFKKHVDIAAYLAPQDHTVQYLLGRFCYEVSELSWWERKMASTLFAEPPISTMEEAKLHFLKAEEIKPEGWKENRLYIAKTCISLNEYKSAFEWLNKALELPCQNLDDEQAHQDVVSLMNEYENYC